MEKNEKEAYSKIEVLEGKINDLKKQAENHRTDIKALDESKTRLREEVDNMEETVRSSVKAAFGDKEKDLSNREHDMALLQQEIKDAEAKNVKDAEANKADAKKNQNMAKELEEQATVLAHANKDLKAKQDRMLGLAAYIKEAVDAQT